MRNENAQQQVVLRELRQKPVFLACFTSNKRHPALKISLQCQQAAVRGHWVINRSNESPRNYRSHVSVFREVSQEICSHDEGAVSD